MNPTDNLEAQLALAKEILRTADDTPGSLLAQQNEQARRAVELARLVRELDDWMTADGFMPRRWAEVKLP